MRVRLGLDGAGRVRVATGAGLYDHLFEQLAFHGGLDLVVDGSGDWETGAHHTAEDTAIALGEALDRALGDRRGIARYGSAVVPMDDALARAAVDLGGRRGAEIELAGRSRARAARAREPRAVRAHDAARRARRAATRTTSPRPRARRSAARCARPCAATAQSCRRRRACCERRDLRVRRRQRALGRARVRAARRRRAIARRRRARCATPTSPCFPGVGSAGSAMAGLRARGLDAALRERAAAGRPILGICLGLQLALDESEEDGGVAGPRPRARARGAAARRAACRASAGRRVEPGGEAFWFAHSYAAETPAATATSEGARRRSSSTSRSLGVQFHPEKSGAAGARFLERCLSRV